jgi:hypothetical protein
MNLWNEDPAMSGAVAALMLLLAPLDVARADSYVVDNPLDSGVGSLRWAIGQANANGRPDAIKFVPSMAGKTIKLMTALPALTNPGTVILADMGADGTPDVQLDGRSTGPYGSGLEIRGARCEVAGLAIGGFGRYGIHLNGVSGCTIRACYLGTGLNGIKRVANGEGDILLEDSDTNVIGGASPAHRNVIATNDEVWGGILLRNSNENTVAGNYIGLKPDGRTAYGGGSTAIGLHATTGTCDRNTIGGTGRGAGNVIGGIGGGISVFDGDANRIAGNYIGLAANGRTQAPLRFSGLVLVLGASYNRIGGTTASARNVFAGGVSSGIFIRDPETQRNVIFGNYFGLNARGTRQRDIREGITLQGDAGPQIIGGSVPAAGNFFTPRQSDGHPCWGISFGDGGDGSLVRHNTFGVRPDGTDASPCTIALAIADASPRAVDNTFAQAQTGIRVRGAGANPAVFWNVFRRCGAAVSIGDSARCRLGNLGNSNTGDNGGNLFGRTNTWYIRNLTPNRIKAEGSRFRNTTRAHLEARIYDRRDDPSLGPVDFVPLYGGVLPTGETAGLLALAGLSAAPTAVGAEITFTLSADARVDARVLNMAGRPVTAVAQDLPSRSGLQRLAWAGHSNTGLPVPNGTYLVEVTAKADDGTQGRALTQVAIRR